MKRKLKKPVDTEFLDEIKNETISRIHKLPNYHRYPSLTRGELERKTTVISKTPATLTLSVNPVSRKGGIPHHYGDIIEDGRNAITGKKMKFQGYYPNFDLIYKMLRRKTFADARYPAIARRELWGYDWITKGGDVKHVMRIRGHLNVAEKLLKEGHMTREEMLYRLSSFPIGKFSYPVKEGKEDDHETHDFMDELSNPQSGLYTVMIPNTRGVKAAYSGRPPRLLTGVDGRSGMLGWIKQRWAKRLKRSIENIASRRRRV
jgi:hypothetical protein